MKFQQRSIYTGLLIIMASFLFVNHTIVEILKVLGLFFASLALYANQDDSLSLKNKFSMLFICSVVLFGIYFVVISGPANASVVGAFLVAILIGIIISKEDKHKSVNKSFSSKGYKKEAITTKNIKKKEEEIIKKVSKKTTAKKTSTKNSDKKTSTKKASKEAVKKLPSKKVVKQTIKNKSDSKISKQSTKKTTKKETAKKATSPKKNK